MRVLVTYNLGPISRLPSRALSPYEHEGTCDNFLGPSLNAPVEPNLKPGSHQSAPDGNLKPGSGNMLLIGH